MAAHNYDCLVYPIPRLLCMVLVVLKGIVNFQYQFFSNLEYKGGKSENSE